MIVHNPEAFGLRWRLELRVESLVRKAAEFADVDAKQNVQPR